MPRKTKAAQKPKSEPKKAIQAESEPQLVTVTATRDFYDIQRDANCMTGAVWETNKERAKSLEERGFVRVLQ